MGRKINPNMIEQQYKKNLKVPKTPVDVILDTDAFNEIDDQFAIAYLINCSEKLNIKAICAAPFLNEKSDSYADGMEKSYNEILKVLSLAGNGENLRFPVLRGSKATLADMHTPIISDAAEFIARLAMEYSSEKPLYIVGIGAATNIASALLINPEIRERVVVIWLGGNARDYKNPSEFNLEQDRTAAEYIFSCGVPVVQVPCVGVVSEFRISGPELMEFFVNKTPLSDYLARNAIREAERNFAGKMWTRVIWDVCAVAWLMNDNGLFMIDEQRYIDRENCFGNKSGEHMIGYVYRIRRDALMNDMSDRITKNADNGLDL